MKKNKSTIIIIFIALLCEFAVIYYFIKPKVDLFFSQNERINQISIEITTLEEEQKNLNNLVKQKQTVEETGIIANNLIPEEAKMSNFMLELDSLAKSYNLAIPNITIDEKKDIKTAQKTEEGENKSQSANSEVIYPAGIKVLNFKTTVSGTYDDFLNFLTKLESASRLNSLPALSLSPANGVVTVALDGDIFYLPEQDEASTKTKVNLDKNNLEKIKLLVQQKPFEKPSTSGSDGRDNPFADL